MGGKAKSRCHLGMQKVNKLRQCYLDVIKLENYGPIREWLYNNQQTLQKFYFVFFHKNFKDTKSTKMADPILESSLKKQI